MDKDQFAAATANTYELRSFTCVQVDNGFKLQGQRRFLNNDTGIASVELSREGVATDTTGALAAIKLFLETGTFVPVPKSA